jgi:predicted RNase H-like HicB family nuclease
VLFPLLDRRIRLVSARTRQRNRQKPRRRERPSPQQQGGEAGSVELPYPVTLFESQGDGGPWVATVDALAGCTGRGDTPQAALEAVSDAMSAWLEAAAREGREAPEPKSLQSHSGRLLLRMPQTLHAELSRLAERENVSLNQFITDVLAGALGWRVPARLGRIATRPVQGDPAGINGAGEPDSLGEAGLRPAEPQKRSARFLSTALVVNFVIVALAAIVAIVVLIAAWR